MNEFGKLQAKNIHLHRADIVTASIENPLELVAIDILGFNLGLGFSIGFNPDKKLVKTELEVSIRTDPEEYERAVQAAYFVRQQKAALAAA